MAVNKIDLPVGLSTSRGPSPSIWGDCPWLELVEDPTKGFVFFDDFLSTPKTPPTTEGNYGQYAAFTSTGGTMVDGATIGGALTIASDGDDEGASLRTLITPFRISRSYGDLWFEARLKSSTITDAKHNILIGLMQDVALTATMPITAAGALADTNFVGFQRPESAKAGAGTGGATLNVLYKADGVTAVTVASDVATLVADTYVKLGMRYYPRRDKRGDYVLVFFVNGVPVAQKIIPSAAGTDFPNDINLGPVFAVLNSTGTTPGNSTIDWWRVAQTPDLSV